MTKIHIMRYGAYAGNAYVDNGITLYLQSGKILSLSQYYNTKHTYSMNEFLLLAVFSKLYWKEETATDIIAESYKQKEIH